MVFTAMRRCSDRVEGLADGPHAAAGQLVLEAQAEVGVGEGRLDQPLDALLVRQRGVVEQRIGGGIRRAGHLASTIPQTTRRRGAAARRAMGVTRPAGVHAPQRVRAAWPANS
jgi:hypothetical protein